jgi:hypothetical protein
VDESMSQVHSSDSLFFIARLISSSLTPLYAGAFFSGKIGSSITLRRDSVGLTNSGTNELDCCSVGDAGILLLSKWLYDAVGKRERAGLGECAGELRLKVRDDAEERRERGAIGESAGPWP